MSNRSVLSHSSESHGALSMGHGALSRSIVTTYDLSPVLAWVRERLIQQHRKAGSRGRIAKPRRRGMVKGDVR
eukprot:895795-Amphidinium_carterae.1